MIVLALCVHGAVPISGDLRFERTNRTLLDRGGPGSFDECQVKYPCVLKVGDEWWMWYNGRAKDCFTGQIGLAKSPDGLAWTKANGGQPVFHVGAAGTFDSTKVDHPAVLRFGGKFHMWYTAGPDQGGDYRIGYATSPDGLAWTRENGGKPVLGPGAKGKFDDSVVLHPAVVRDQQGVLHLWYNGVGPLKKFRVGHATSRDGIGWTRQNNGDAVLEPGEVEGRREDYVYNVMVLLEAGTYHVWISSAINHPPREYRDHANAIVYASSKDGTHWRRAGKPVFYNGPRGTIDEYSAFAPYVVRRDDGLWMYYSCGSLAEVPSGSDNRRFDTSLAIHRCGARRT